MTRDSSNTLGKSCCNGARVLAISTGTLRPPKEESLLNPDLTRTSLALKRTGDRAAHAIATQADFQNRTAALRQDDTGT